MAEYDSWNYLTVRGQAKDLRTSRDSILSAIRDYTIDVEPRYERDKEGTRELVISSYSDDDVAKALISDIYKAYPGLEFDLSVEQLEDGEIISEANYSFSVQADIQALRADQDADIRLRALC